MILEALVTTVDELGHVNLAPMGPHVDSGLTQFILRPFNTSRTYANLRATGCAVVHISDNTLLLAQAAINQLVGLPDLVKLDDSRFIRLADCCRWFALEIDHWLEDPMRPAAVCRLVASGSVRDFFGFCRAKHAVVEAAILATRVHMLNSGFLQSELDRLRTLVDKTGGTDEIDAFDLISAFVERQRT